MCVFVPLLVFYRRLNNNEISILEATGLFKKLSHLKKM